jgi:hypothetical protein
VCEVVGLATQLGGIKVFLEIDLHLNAMESLTPPHMRVYWKMLRCSSKLCSLGEISTNAEEKETFMTSGKFVDCFLLMTFYRGSFIYRRRLPIVRDEMHNLPS